MDQYAAWNIQVDDFVRGLEVLKGETTDAADEALAEALRKALAEAKGTDKFREQTGALKDSLWTDQSFSLNQARGFLKADAKYASFVEYGTRPHPIFPRRRFGRLQFYWENAGRWFIGFPGQGVRHPGTKPTRFLQYAALEGETMLENRLRSRFESAAAKFNKH
jgi:hypothetical protein